MPYITIGDDIDVYDFFHSCSDSEKRELYDLCCDEYDVSNVLETIIESKIESRMSHDDKTFTSYLNKMASERWKMSKEDEETVMAIAKKYFFV